MRARFVILALVAAPLSFLVNAQDASLPKEISGRWSFSGGSNLFSLDELARTGDGTFSAKLTWWTRDPACVVRSQLLTGIITATGLKFESSTKCGVEFAAELNRSGAQWIGKATTKQGVVVDMKAD